MSVCGKENVSNGTLILLNTTLIHPSLTAEQRFSCSLVTPVTLILPFYRVLSVTFMYYATSNSIVSNGVYLYSIHFAFLLYLQPPIA